VLAVGTAGAAGAAVTVAAGGAAAVTVTGAAAASVTVTGTAASAVTVTAGGAAAVTVTGAGAAVGCGAGVLAEALPSEIPTTAATTMPVIHNHLRLFFLGATGGGDVSLRMAMVGAFLLLQELFPAVSARAGSRTPLVPFRAVVLIGGPNEVEGQLVMAYKPLDIHRQRSSSAASRRCKGPLKLATVLPRLPLTEPPEAQGCPD